MVVRWRIVDSVTSSGLMGGGLKRAEVIGKGFIC